MGKEIYKTMISDSEPNVSETRKTRSQSLQYSFLMALGQKLRPFFASGTPPGAGKDHSGGGSFRGCRHKSPCKCPELGHAEPDNLDANVPTGMWISRFDDVIGGLHST